MRVTLRELDGAPSITRLYALALLPGQRRTSGALPDVTLRRHGVRTDLAHLAAYTAVCGFGLRDTLPATYPHLAAFGLQLELMVDRSFPARAIGLVHLRNSITQHRPIGVSEVLDIDVTATDRRPHPRGRLIDLRTVVRTDDDVVWEETTTLLARGSGAGEEITPAPLGNVQAPPAGPTTWHLGADLGRRYADVSGDRNPIHLYAITAKAFGFPRQIAHGMWTAARCLSALEGRLPDVCTVDVEFRRPVLLPSTVRFGSVGETHTTTFGVTAVPRDDRAAPTHLIGRVTPL